MNEVVNQAPEGIDSKIIREVFERNNEDTLKTLMELWDIKENKKEVITNKWDEIRDICDSYDTEMSNFMKNCKKNATKL